MVMRTEIPIVRSVYRVTNLCCVVVFLKFAAIDHVTAMRNA
jgi:hypothetical protein